MGLGGQCSALVTLLLGKGLGIYCRGGLMGPCMGTENFFLTRVWSMDCPDCSELLYCEPLGLPPNVEALDLSWRSATLVKFSSIPCVVDSRRVSICGRFTRLCRLQANVKHTTSILNKQLNLNIQEKTYIHIYHSTLNTLGASHSLWLVIQHSSCNPIFQSSQSNNYISLLVNFLSGMSLE
jgi:hypothetical protein